MKKAIIGLLLSIVFFTWSCQKTISSGTQSCSMKMNPTKAQMLALSEQDITLLDEHHPEILRKIHKREKISMQDVIAMHEIFISPDSMILIIEYTKSLFTLSTSDVIRLQAEGVPFKVINYMIRT